MCAERATKSPLTVSKKDRTLSVATDHQCEEVTTAARLGHSQCLSRMPNNKLVERDENGVTALHHIVAERDYEAAKLLLERAPTLREITSRDGETPAHLAAAAGEERIVELLLAGPYKHTKKAALTRDCDGTSILLTSVVNRHNPVAFWLLKKFGKEINSLPNNYGTIPLHVAASQGNLEFVKRAVKCDAKSVDARDCLGCSPAAYAAQSGHLKVLRCLVDKSHAVIGCVNLKGQSLLHIASLRGHEKIAGWIVNRIGSKIILWATTDDCNAVHCAAYSGSVSVLRLLLRPWSHRKRRALLALKDGRGNTPLHLAAMNDHFNAVVFLLEMGADVRALNSSGYSAYAIASTRGSRQIAAYIAEKSENFKITSSSPGSPMLALPALADCDSGLRSETLSPTSNHSLSPTSSSGYSSATEPIAESTINRVTVMRRQGNEGVVQRMSTKGASFKTDESNFVERLRVRQEDDTSTVEVSVTFT